MDFLYFKNKTDCLAMDRNSFKEKFIRILISCTPKTPKQEDDFYYLITNTDKITLILLSPYREEVITFYLLVEDKKNKQEKITVEDNETFFRRIYSLYTKLYNTEGVTL